MIEKSDVNYCWNYRRKFLFFPILRNFNFFFRHLTIYKFFVVKSLIKRQISKSHKSHATKYSIHLGLNVQII